MTLLYNKPNFTRSALIIYIFDVLRLNFSLWYVGSSYFLILSHNDYLVIELFFKTNSIYFDTKHVLFKDKNIVRKCTAITPNGNMSCCVHVFLHYLSLDNCRYMIYVLQHDGEFILSRPPLNKEYDNDKCHVSLVPCSGPWLTRKPTAQQIKR